MASANSQTASDCLPIVSAPELPRRDSDVASIADSIIMVDAFGAEATVKNLFKDPFTKCYREARSGDEIVQPSADEKHALIVRREINPEKNKMKLISITVQSPYLKELLGKVFNGFMGISTELREVEFSAPFHEMCFKWTEIEAAVNELQDETAKQHAALFQPIIKQQITQHLDRMHDLASHGLITYDYLWSIFEPGTDIVTNMEGFERIYRIRGCENKIGKNDKFEIQAEHIDTDGTSFGYVHSKFELARFKGLKKISSLDYVPAAHHPRIEEVRSRLAERGARFRAFFGIHHVSYAGTYVPEKSEKTKKKQTMSYGRVIIDNESCVANSDIKQPKLESTLSEDDLPESKSQPDIITSLGSETLVPSIRRHAYDERKRTIKTLPQDLLPYCMPTVRGYCLTSRQWGQFEIDNIKPVSWASDAVSRLIIPWDWKEILLGLVVSQLGGEDSFDDIIAGKGQGMVMLLAGAPGIGKTLTAESIAEEMKMPLYSMGMGQLGQTASTVEKNLRTHMDLSTKWGAMMLLDECDVFLARRTVKDLERNKLVSVFLRTLEWFQGVMFLTTNRIQAFDPAFESRIHLTFNYPDLDKDARLRVWKNFVGKAEETEFKEDHDEGSLAWKCRSALTNADLNALASIETNGRVIKNVVKTARLLAIRTKQPMSMRHVETVLRVKGLRIRESDTAVEPRHASDDFQEEDDD